MSGMSFVVVVTRKGSFASGRTGDCLKMLIICLTTT